MQKVVDYMAVQKWAQDNFLSARESSIAGSIMPLGKYEGQLVHDVPLGYLFETISDMRPSFFTFAIAFLLKQEWFIDECLREHVNERFQFKRGVTWRQVYSSRCQRLCPLLASTSRRE